MRLIYKTYRIKEGRQASKHLLALRESSLTMYLPGLNSETVLGNKLCNKAIKKKITLTTYFKLRDQTHKNLSVAVLVTDIVYFK